MHRRRLPVEHTWTPRPRWRGIIQVQVDSYLPPAYTNGRPSPATFSQPGGFMNTLTDEQLNTLASALDPALNPRKENGRFKWDCEHDHARTTRILTTMGFTPTAIEAILEELSNLGGHCDCEVMLNVVCREA